MPPPCLRARRQPPADLGRQPSVRTSIPFLQTVWQLRQCCSPSIVTRHSKQIPIPHNGPRGSPVTERRNACVPVFRIAADTMLPPGISTETPLTTSVTVSGMHRLLCHSRGQVRRDWNRSFAIHDLRNKQFRGSERGRDTEALVTGGEIEALVFRVWTNEWKLIRRRGAKSCPRAQRREFSESRQVFHRPIEHARKNLNVNMRVLDAKLSRR